MKQQRFTSGLKSLQQFEARAHATRKKIAPDLLAEAANTFKERNALYGNTYQRYGGLLAALFPTTGIPACRDAESLERLNILMMCLAKLQRYAHNFHKGGHQDSARDLQVYAAMLEEFTNE